MKYSFIIPVFNRPDEVAELLASMTRQTCHDFEVIVVEDGSQVTCQTVCEGYADRLDLHYYVKENGGPGEARNYGAARAKGTYLLILDSDVVLPEGYLAAVDAELCRQEADAFGGPDAAHPDFTPIQKAISYSMTSFFTTGGIRGGRKKLDKFYPRSFNMGIRSAVYQALSGFSKMRFGEDIDFSIRIIKAGYRCRLFPEAWVWHKRRTDFRKFFRQVYNSGIARINLFKRYPESLKLVHLLPAVFTVGTAMLAMAAVCGGCLALTGATTAWRSAGRTVLWIALLPLLLYALLIFTDATRTAKSLRVGLLAVPAAFIQLGGYGMGFLHAWWNRCVKGQDEFAAFEKNFYK